MKSGEQTPSIYKYFEERSHMEEFLQDGLVYFNSLSYFLSCEDPSRKDSEEDTYVYRPNVGLRVHNLTTKKEFILFDMQINSKVTNPHQIFIFCASIKLNKVLYEKFKSKGCVEIFRSDVFKERIQSQIDILYGQKILGCNQLLSGPVDYYSCNDEPGVRHALPEKIIMQKSADKYGEEGEYRFALAEDCNAFAVNNVKYFLSTKSVSTSTPPNHKILRLGPLLDICRVAEPPDIRAETSP